MAITINEQVIEVNRVLTGSDSFIVNGDDWFKIEKTGDEILNQQVPAGKKWQVEVTVRIEESNE